MMPELILELPDSGTVATIVPFLMLECLMLSLRTTSLLVQQQLFEDTRAENVELMRSVYERWKGACSFTPLVFSSSGGMGKAATVTYRHLASFLVINGIPPIP